MGMYAREHHVDEPARLGLGEFGRDGHEPATLVGEGRAFYGIFLRHEHGQRVAELQVARLERVMIRHRMFVDREARIAQHVEEALRIADGRDRVDAPAPEARERAQAPATTHRPGVSWPQAHLETGVLDELRELEL